MPLHSLQVPQHFSQPFWVTGATSGVLLGKLGRPFLSLWLQCVRLRCATDVGGVVGKEPGYRGL